MSARNRNPGEVEVDGEVVNANVFEAEQVAKFKERDATWGVGSPAAKTRVIDQCGGDNWHLYHGDSCEVLRGFPDNSVDFSVFSPPFRDLFVYSDSPRDLGNCATPGEFSEQYKFLAREQFRIHKTGRLVAVHCMDLPKTLTKDGMIGISDFPGELVRLYESVGFVFHSRIIIWKDPVFAMQRTHARGLLHKELCKDSSVSRMGMCDQVLVFGKPGKNESTIRHKGDALASKQGGKPIAWQRVASPVWAMPVTDDDIDPDTGRPIFWNRYASPVWASASGVGEDGFVTYCNPTDDNRDRRGIDTGDTLQRQKADGDEKHICPLQRGVIRRCIDLWSLPGENVLTPFAGIASEMVCAIEAGRKAAGVELKLEYYQQGKGHILAALRAMAQMALPLSGETPT